MIFFETEKKWFSEFRKCQTYIKVQHCCANCGHYKGGNKYSKSKDIYTKYKLVEGRSVSYFQSVKELNLGPSRTNPSNAWEEDLILGHPDYKASALTTTPYSPF